MSLCTTSFCRSLLEMAPRRNAAEPLDTGFLDLEPVAVNLDADAVADADADVLAVGPTVGTVGTSSSSVATAAVGVASAGFRARKEARALPGCTR